MNLCIHLFFLSSVTALSSWPTACQSANVLSDCTNLLSRLPGKVFFPNSTVYNSTVSSYFFLEERLTPPCIVTPSSAEDVSIVVQALSAPDTATFSIRSGGHSPNVGFSNSKNGITVDLQNLKNITVSSDGSVTSVGTGLRWVDIYHALDPFKLGVVGGRVGHVGVGGLTTGGGISTFSPQRGFACDNVVNMEVVLASGAIVNANATSNPDLFAALKGGQNNFGIVTRFDLKSFSQGLYWGGGIEYSSAAIPAQLAAFTYFKSPANFDPYAEIEQSYLYLQPENSVITSNNMFYTKPVVNASALKEFTTIQPQILNTMRISNSTDFANELTEFQPMNQYAVYATATFHISPTILSEVFSLWNASITKLSAVTNLTGVLTYQSIPPPPPLSAPNSLGFPTNSTPQKDLVLCLLSNYWSLSSDSATVQTSTQSLMSAIKTVTRQKKLAIDYTYLNYAAAWQDPLGSYGPAQLAKLRQVAKKYDPRGVFQTKVPGGFKVSLSREIGKRSS